MSNANGSFVAGMVKDLAMAPGKNLLDATPLTHEGRKNGMAEVAPYLRGGLLDLQNFFAKAFPDSRQQESVLGMIGVPTPGMVDLEQETKASKEEQKSDKQAKSPQKSIMGYDLPAQAPAQGKEMEQERGREM
jgi:hypothetical protein